MAYDFIVIGSGVAGGRIAWELTKGGAKCALLEAGKHFEAKDFPLPEVDSSAQLFWGGGLEISSDGRLGFLRAKCVGGTSIVNQALLDRFDALAWDDWKDRSGIADFNETAFEPLYRELESEVSIQAVPEKHYTENARIFTRALDAAGLGWAPLRRAQKDCALDHGSDCMACLGGCPRESKQSSLVTTVRWAVEKGCDLESDFEVVEIAEREGEVLVRGLQRGNQRTLVASRVVLAAGAFGNTKILWTSDLQKKLPYLGKGFCSHVQFMSYGLFEQPVNAHKGAFQAVKSYDPGLRAKGFKLENVFAPPISTAMLIPGHGPQHLEAMKRYRHLASMEVAIRDEPVGEIRCDKKGKLVVNKRLTLQDRTRAREGRTLIRDLFLKAGAKNVIECDQGFGLHLMGGCAIGQDEKTSVVNPEFRVHGMKRVFAADSSVFPSAPGINPSFTIMAIAKKASKSILGAAT